MKNNNKRESYYAMPKALFTSELKSISIISKVLYALIRDRYELSLKNDWEDNEGETYLIFSRKEMCEMLGATDKTVKKCMDELITANLIREKRMGVNKANRIYVLPFETGKLEKEISTDGVPENLRFKNRKNSDSRTGKTPYQEPEKFRPNQLSDNLLNFSDLESSRALAKIKAAIGYKQMTDEHKEMADTFLKTLNEQKRQNETFDAFNKLNDKMTKVVFDRVLSSGDTISNLGRYLITALSREIENTSGGKNISRSKKQITCERNREYTEEELEEMLLGRRRKIHNQ